MTWFTDLFGFPESRAAVERYLHVDGTSVHSSANGRSFTSGTLRVASLGELRDEADASLRSSSNGHTTVREVVGDAVSLHADPANRHALFQVASQANLLEMVSPDVTPDDGITRYEGDHTQGPACAMACAAGTVVRNWFAQTSKAQIDTFARLGDTLDNLSDDAERGAYWTMSNGYALLTGATPLHVPESHDHLEVGLQIDTEVTVDDAGHLVTQAYCSALPIAYSGVEASQVEPLARMVLNSTYEATIAAGVTNAERTGNRTVFLTLVGGGVFGNPIGWITDAIERAVRIYASAALDVAIVSHRNRNPHVERVLT